MQLSNSQLVHLRFSREKENVKLAGQLRDNFFVAITGPSGCGKSTLVYEYLCKSLKHGEIQGQAGADWRIVSVVPGANPIGNLADALALPGANGLYEDGQKSPDFRDEVELLLRTRQDAIPHLYNQAASLHPDPFNLLIIVDNLQDLARYHGFLQKDNSPQKGPALNSGPFGKTGDDVRFVNHLLSMSDAGIPAYLVFITDNSYQEFYSRYRGLLEKMNTSRYPVFNVDTEEIRNSLSALKKDIPEIGNFENQLLTSYAGLIEGAEPDSYAMLKFNLTLKLAVIGEFPPMRSAVDYYAQEKVFNTLTSDQQQLCTQLFKALTENSGFLFPVRIPRSIDELMALCIRPPKINPANPKQDFRLIIDKFNALGESFLKVVGPEDLSAYSIIDIYSNALTESWTQVKEWATAESNDAEVFRTVYRDALDYYLHLPDLPKEQAEYKKKLYNGASLFSALNWKQLSLPNPAWARRYMPEQLNLKPEELKQFKSLINGKHPETATRLELCMAFIDASEKNFTDEMKQKDDALSTAIRQRKKARIASMAISALAVIACIIWTQAWSEKKNIALMNFVKILHYNDVLDIPFETETYTLNSINEKIVDDFFINSEVKVLNLLEEKGFLKFDNKDPQLKGIFYDALLNMNNLYQSLQNNRNLKDASKVKRDLDKIKTDLGNIYKRYQDYLAKKDSDVLMQSPPLFNTIYAHVVAWETGFQNNGLSDTKDPGDSLILKTIIDPNCLAVNHASGTDLAYGGLNGAVYFRKEDSPIKKIGEMGSPIKSMAFNQLGDALFVGTENGQIFRFDRPEFMDVTHKPVLVFTSPNNTPIHFIGEYHSGKTLLVRSNNQLMFLDPKNSPDQYAITAGPFKSALDFVIYGDWSPDQRFFVETSYNRSVIYQIDFSQPNPQNRLRKLCELQHQNRTMIRAAIAPSYEKGDDAHIWLALGAMGGRIWLGEFNLKTLEAATTLSLSHEGGFYNLDALDAPISALAFNPQRPQLAGSSAEGAIGLWNLQRYKKDAETIRVRNHGQGVTGLAFMRDDDLVVYENSTHYIIKTSIDALWRRLNCLYNGCE